jgi:hypothetical protein
MRQVLRLGRRVGSAMAVALLVLSGSCRDAPTAPTAAPNTSDPSKLFGLPGFGGTPRLLSCPSDEAQSSSAVIGVDGGVLSVGGTSVSIPLGALLDETKVEMSIPAGQYMEVDLTVNDGQHITFLKPVVVTIDYSRCNRYSTLFRLLSVWNIDETSKALIENMGGFDNKLAQTITFISWHFTGFAIAY